MQGQQLQLWEPKGGSLPRRPPIYQDLTPEQRRQIAGRLARLILNRVRKDANTAANASHER